MKIKSIVTGLLLLFGFFLHAEKVIPARWSWSLKPANPKVGEVADVIFKVKIDKGWYLYSSDFDPELGPVVTTVTFEKHPSFELVGKLKPINPHSKFDKEIWGGTYTYFTELGEFRQKIKIKSGDLKINGAYDSQACSNESGLCVPIKGIFGIKLKVESGELKGESGELKVESGELKVESGDWKINYLLFTFNSQLSTFHFQLSTLCQIFL